MAQLYKLTYAKSKNKKTITLMIDILRKCENYKKARSVQHAGHYVIEPVEYEKKFKKKSPKSGYILKGRFNAHT